MAKRNGDIPDYFSDDFFRKVLESGLRTTDIHILDAEIQNITIGGENYCSDIYRATIKYQTKDNPDMKKKISFIIKTLPVSKQDILSRLDIYSKETAFYLDVKPKMEVLMWNAKESWHLAAKHYYSTTEPEQTILMQDLCTQGFELKSRQVGLDAEHSILVMKKLAEYHALSMRIEEKEPDIITERYPFGLLNIESIKTEAFKMLFGGQLMKLISLLDEYNELQEIAGKLLKYKENFTERVLNAVYPLRGDINVLNHGDLWVNNLLFQYDSRRCPREVRFIDFQLCFYGSPGFDINYFLNTSVQLNVLKNCRQSLIETYFETLTDVLQKLNYNKSLPSYETVLNEIQQREAYGFFVAFGFFPLMSMIAMDSKDNSLEKFHDEDFAKQKIELMFTTNTRTMDTLKYTIKRLDQLGIFN